MLRLPNELLELVGRRAGAGALLALSRTCGDLAWLAALARPTVRRPESWPMAAVVADGEIWRQMGEHLYALSLTSAPCRLWREGAAAPVTITLPKGMGMYYGTPNSISGNKFIVYGHDPVRSSATERYLADCSGGVEKLARPKVGAWCVFLFDGYFAEVKADEAAFYTLDGRRLCSGRGTYKPKQQGHDPMLALDGRLILGDGPAHLVALGSVGFKALPPFAKQNNSDCPAFLCPTARRVVLVTKHGKATVYDRGTLEREYAADLAKIHGSAIEVRHVLARGGDVQILFDERLDSKAEAEGAKTRALKKKLLMYWRPG